MRSHSPLILAAATLPLAVMGSLAAAQSDGADPSIDANAIEAATYDGGPLPEGQSALTAKVQVLLDRANISPGIVDGWKGGMSSSAIHAFEVREGLTADGVMDQAVWDALGGNAAAPITSTYTVTEEDHARIGGPLPDDYAEMAKMDWLHYTSVSEKLAEDFHMDQEFLEALNPGSNFAPGNTITVVQPTEDATGEVADIEIDKSSQRLIARDASGGIIANYPVAIGSEQTPSPSGNVEVEAIAIEPTYSYNPDLNFQQGDNDEFLTIPPGPNGPVGLVWIDLSKPTYGIHGTPEPASLFTAQSHGCVRMTNWDALELAHMVSAGTTVRFVE
ncbi:L,D-transpeptidase family protein [Thalassorhabdomicrobium marinisediminis]|uniref:Murein L,D-transpeptidase n=1 Tax=Thalassorhabdomicrobium marinisediminis TaxID=2170577 RepID=A0A2T7FT27_9RHOB|nr:L,D-transpeptidase [Thalassorhabdomicrobium marinisediminis]PVA05292.1 murein L,D-transpeptidase [Thalassorhabdomicrobium marinisediminis]